MSDYEPPSVSSTTTPTARKEHDCCECPRPIQPGKRYEHVKGCWDGSWSTYKTCLPCVELRAEYADEDGCYTFGYLSEALQCRAPSGVYEAWQAGGAS